VLAAHLEHCARCAAVLEIAAAEGDSVDRLMRAWPGIANPFADEPEYRRMAHRIKDDLPAAENASAGDADAPGQAAPVALGSYQLGERLGAGGMGTVYRAFHTRLKKWFALKVLNSARMEDPQAVARFQREMEALGRLEHPNLVRATDAGEAGAVHFLVMELIDGIDLARLVRARGPLPAEVAAALVRQTALGLQYAHEQGLVHRDIKPSNLLLSRQGQVKILDLGLARLVGERPAAELTAQGQLLGTADYMAPEQWQPGELVDIRADLYSLGCTLYTLLAGHPPFSGPAYDSQSRKMAGHLYMSPSTIAALRSDVPIGVVQIIERLLAKKPAERYATPRDLVGALEPFALGVELAGLVERGPDAESGQSPTQTFNSTEASTPRRKGQRLRLFVVTCVAVGLLGLLGAYTLWPTTAVQTDPMTRQGPSRGADLGPGAQADLLAEAPIELLWPAKTEGSRWEYDRHSHLLWLHCLGRGLLQLASIRGERYEFEIALSQTPWAGGVGLFFRGRTDGTGQEAHFSADVMLLQHLVGSPDPASAVLNRGMMHFFPQAQRNYPNWDSMDRFPRPEPGKHRLKVRVGPAGLEAIAWDDRPVAKALLDPGRHRVSRTGAHGSVGLFLQNGTACVHAASLSIHPTLGEEP
jgi:serine/threonine protein kinase